MLRNTLFVILHIVGRYVFVLKHYLIIFHYNYFTIIVVLLIIIRITPNGHIRQSSIIIVCKKFDSIVYLYGI